MMKYTMTRYMDHQPFSVYYMSISGHCNYAWTANAMSKKNREAVEGLSYSEHVKGYLAANLELEYAMKYLVDRLDQAGKLDNTLIVLVGDHYPYYLTDKAAKSLVGYLPETDFERYHSTCMMWFNGLAEPIVCDTPCCNSRRQKDRMSRRVVRPWYNTKWWSVAPYTSVQVCL